MSAAFNAAICAFTRMFSRAAADFLPPAQRSSVIASYTVSSKQIAEFAVALQRRDFQRVAGS
jgi:hypothetical protein